MLQKSLLPFYISVIVYLTAMYFEATLWLWTFKPLLILTLIFHFLQSTKIYHHKIKKLVIAALIFSMMGDIFLMLPDNENYFIFGLGSFLIAHIFYIFAFLQIRKELQQRLNIWFIIFPALYCIILLNTLLPNAGALAIPVVFYAIIISCMLVAALHCSIIQNKNTGWFFAAAAMLFVISDSFIGLDKFYMNIKGNSWIVMLTYMSAQLLLTVGFSNYISYASKK